MSQTLLRKRSNILQNSILYEFQKKLLNQIEADYLIAAGTGTGKTMMAIHHYLRHSKGEGLLIVAPPQKVKEGGWDREVETVNRSYDIDIRYETLSYGVLSKRWQDYKGWFVVFDECHYIKNPTSQRGKAGINLTKISTHFLLLSATPSSNGWGDTITYMIMFGHFKNKTDFLRQHAIYEDKYFGPRPVKVVSDYKNQDKLKKLYQSFSIKLSKDECLDLPPLTFEDVRFEPSKEYKVIEKERVLNDELYDTISKLQHGLRFYANQTDKLKYSEMLTEGTNENIIFFYYYQQEKEELMKSMKKLGKIIFEVSGQASNLPSKSEWDQVNNSVTLVQYMAGSAGIELQYANIVVFYTPTYSYQDYDQALGRAYRNGQTKKVTVYRYITKQTIEEAVYGALNQKKDFTEDLFRKEIGT
ncbi:DEAD/DEAH box helicase [Halalkalibacterium halodurans]|uniref:DEAD/DEAH box helicase n=1 Tax=Halalkalibacterium halodurans TaxID=86665 RepID=UPI002AAA438B|nr:DEAD/DEAH box helicase [Halalkalibacterium halodurans]MDY7224687.1 DEAD/DEAH box helicase [Halalkalibacterium halodurans]MDY7243263.1 DEAD/DEAH box helicase [Halalkalibacterium halodurans]